ncbi:MAG TPA: Wzz/FepE/Etk N-terminal domain-containing protein [Candidatus Kapabacteria bacterium]|nr:Wzz/FepE/Etk N-terminal domain-containing protein [Candidatus Kapabacteria bacterium]
MNKSEDFSSIHILALLLKYKVFILSLTITATIIAGVAAFYFLENEYKATANVVPPQTQDALQSTIGMIASPLKDFGLSKLAGKALSTNYNFIVILTSRSVLDSIINEFDLIKVYKIKNNLIDDARDQLFDNLEINYEKDGNYFISVWDKDPKRAASMTNRLIQVANNVAIRIYREEIRLNKENMEARIKSTDSTIKVIADTLEKFSRRTLMFAPEEQVASIAKSLSDLKSEEIKYDIIYDYYRNTYGENDYLTKSIAQLKQATSEKVRESKDKPGFAGNFAVNETAKEGIEYMRLYTEFETYSKVKAFLLPAMEQTRMDEFKGIKNLIFIDKAVPPTKKDRPKRSLIIAGTFIGTFVLSVLIIILIYIYREVKDQLKVLNND